MPTECKTFLSEVPTLLAEKKKADDHKWHEVKLMQDACSAAAL